MSAPSHRRPAGFVVTCRILAFGFSLWLLSYCSSTARTDEVKGTSEVTPAGSSVREIVEAGLAQMNATGNFGIQFPERRGIVTRSYCNGFVPKMYQRKRVRWQGTVVENTDKTSKAILVRVGTFKAPGQIFQATVGVDAKLAGNPSPVVGAEVWLEGAVTSGEGWISATRVDESNVTIDLPYFVANARLLGTPSAESALTPVPDVAKLEQQASSRLKLARQLADIGKVDKAREWCREILDLYPFTKAAEESRQLLKLLDKP